MIDVIKLIAAAAARSHYSSYTMLRPTSARRLVVLDARDMLHDALAVRSPRIDAEGEVSS